MTAPHKRTTLIVHDRTVGLDETFHIPCLPFAVSLAQAQDIYQWAKWMFSDGSLSSLARDEFLKFERDLRRVIPRISSKE